MWHNVSQRFKNVLRRFYALFTSLLRQAPKTNVSPFTAAALLLHTCYKSISSRIYSTHSTITKFLLGSNCVIQGRALAQKQ